MRKALVLLLTLAILPAAAAPDVPVEKVVARMQAFYEKTRGFDTRFGQTFQQPLVPSRLGNSATGGRLRFQKPQGKTGPFMRWDYDDGRIILLVKDRTFTYDPDTKQATEYTIDPGQLSAAVTFMWGKGKLADEFVITRASRTDLEPGGVALELTPRKPSSAYKSVFLVTDPATGAVMQSVVVQPSGSENRIVFQKPDLQATLSAADFVPEKAFPPGTTIVRAAVPGH